MSVSTMPPGTASEAQAPEKKKGKLGKLFKLLVIGVGVVALAGAAWYFLLRSDPNAEPVPGEVLPLEAQQVNLAQGHYLSIGIALQLVEGAHEVDGSKALDATIEIFSNKAVSDLSLPDQREALKAELTKELKHRYHDEVLDVYFTQFVTQ